MDGLGHRLKDAAMSHAKCGVEGVRNDGASDNMGMIAATAAVAAFALFAAAGEPTVLSDGAIEIRFASPDEGLGCAGIVNRLTGGERFVDPQPQGGATLWEAFLRDADAPPTNAPVRISNRAPAAVRRAEKLADGALRLFFEGVDLPGEKGGLDVVADVRLVGEGRSEWRVAARTKSRRWTVSEVRYPYLANIGAGRAVDLLEPSLGMGARLLKNYGADAASIFFPYPGGYPMVGAYMRGGGGIYLGAHDPDSTIKGVLFRRNQEFCFTRVAENIGVAGKVNAVQRYPVVLQAFRGDWWTAAKIYREWALGRKWTAKGPKASRTDYPKRAAELDLVFVVGGDPASASNYVAKLSSGEWKDLKKIVEWTRWGYLPFDCGYPDIRPAFPGMADVSRWSLRERGVAMMPYTNGRLWAKDSASFMYASKDAVKDADGNVPVDFKVKKHGREFAAMCPFAADWQETLASNILAIADATCAGAIYLDQVTCAGARQCHDASHGHALGGGTWWADGYRKSISAMHAALAPRNVPIISEEGGDAWMDVIDGHLLPNMAREDEVPFYPAVYSAHTTYVGTNIMPEGLEFGVYFRSLAKSVLYGVVPGWMHWADRVKYAEHGAALRRAGRFRAENRDFVCYGFLEGEADAPEGAYATRWTDVKRRREAVAFANLTAAPVVASAFGRKVEIAPYSFALAEK